MVIKNVHKLMSVRTVWQTGHENPHTWVFCTGTLTYFLYLAKVFKWAWRKCV